MSHPEHRIDNGFLAWFRSLDAASVADKGDHIFIEHASGDTSTLWKRDEDTALPWTLGALCSIYEQFDGADLFSSAFKIASVWKSRVVGGVEVVGTLADYRKKCERAGASFLEECTPFMVGSGQWLYAVGSASGVIYEWDLEYSELSADQYVSVEQIIQEWYRNVRRE